MATTIQNLHSLTAGNQPGDLMPGEIAYNLADGFEYLGTGGDNYVDTLGNIIGPSVNPGGGWQQAIYNATPVNGSVILAGLYDAQDNLVTSVTPAGIAAGFTAGAALPAADPTNDNYYVLVQIGGTMAPPAPTGDAEVGDWIVSTGNGWSLVDQSNVSIPAQNVTVVPSGELQSTNVQSALVELDIEKYSISGGAIGGQVIIDTGLPDADALVVQSGGGAQIDGAVACGSLAAGGDSTVTGNLTVTGNITSAGSSTQGDFEVTGGLQVDGASVLGASAVNATTVNGPATFNNNLSVVGATTLDDASVIDLVATGNVSFQGSGGITISNSLSTTGNPTWNLGSGLSLGINGTTTFYSNANTIISGNLTLGQGNFAGKQITYARPLSGPSGGIVNEDLDNFLVCPGTIIAFGGVTAPAGYVLCDGRSLSTTGIYADLFQAIGYAWGGSGTSFNAPDLRGLFLRGVGTNSKQKMSNGQYATASVVGSTWADTFASHNHILSLNTIGYAGTQFGGQREALAPSKDQMTSTGRPNNGTINVLQGDYPGTAAIGNTGSTQTQPVQAIILYCIKY